MRLINSLKDRIISKPKIDKKEIIDAIDNEVNKAIKKNRHT